MVHIRKMTLEDVTTVHTYGVKESRFTVHEEGPGFWTKDQLTRWVANDRDVLLVAENQGEIVGYVLSHTHVPTGKTEYENLQVLQEHRREGIGESLMREAIELNTKRGTTYHVGLVDPDNKASLNTLISAGMTPQLNFVWVDKK